MRNAMAPARGFGFEVIRLERSRSPPAQRLADPTDNPDPGYPTGGAGPGFGP